MAAEDAVEEQQEEGEEEQEQKELKKEDYLKFRREFDSIKRKHDGEVAESDKIKQQGNHFFSLGLYMQASAMYSEAIELQPQNHVLYCNRAMAYLKQDMPVEALEDANESLKLESSAENIKAYWRKAQALVDLNRFEEAEAAADDGLALQGGNKHLNRVRRVARETTTMRKLCKCEWVAKMPNGIEKRYKFTEKGVLKMTVWGHSLDSTFDLSVEGNPRSFVVRMKPDKQQGPPPPPMPYIFEFHDNDEELWLCHPVNTTELPTTFEGPGFDKMRKGEPVACELTFTEPLDEVCEKYIKEMNEALPLVPPQLPALPSEDEISKEALIMDKIAKLKQTYGLAVHQRATELAKDPTSTSNEVLSSLAKELQKRFVSRKIIPEPKVMEAAAVRELTKAVAGAAAPAKPQEALGCLGSIAARLCGGQS